MCPPAVQDGAVIAVDTSSKERRCAMSQQDVGIVIDRLLADEELRFRFARDRFDTIAELHLLGVALTSDEIDAFVQSDVRLWFGEKERVPGRLH